MRAPPELDRGTRAIGSSGRQRSCRQIGDMDEARRRAAAAQVIGPGANGWRTAPRIARASPRVADRSGTARRRSRTMRRWSAPHKRVRLFQHRVEHRREVAGRGIDDLQHFGGRGLLLQRSRASRSAAARSPSRSPPARRNSATSAISLSVNGSTSRRARAMTPKRLAVAQQRHAEHGADAADRSHPL